MKKQPSHTVQLCESRPPDFTAEIEAAGCFCLSGDKMLLLKRAKDKPQGGFWGSPGGKLEVNESPINAVIRETFEETGIRLDQGQLGSVGTFFVRWPHMDYVFHVFQHTFSICPTVDLNAEHEDYCWVTFEEALLMPLVGGAAELIQGWRQYCFRAEA